MTEKTITNIVRKTGRTAEEARAAILATMPEGRLIQPEDVAQAVLTLAADQTGTMNGEAVVLDGREKPK
jgi:3-hydroxybutyrate dehydrogenase